MEIIGAWQDSIGASLSFAGEGGKAEVRMRYLRESYGGGEDWTVEVLIKPKGEQSNLLTHAQIAGTIYGRNSLSHIANRWASFFVHL